VPSTRQLGLLFAVAIAVVGRLYPLLTVEEVEGGDLPGTFGMLAVAGLSWFLIS